jgi:hypothetical protein
VHGVIEKLREDGVINLDVPARKLVDHLKTLNIPSEDSWHVIGGSHYFIVTELRSASVSLPKKHEKTPTE